MQRRGRTRPWIAAVLSVGFFIPAAVALAKNEKSAAKVDINSASVKDLEALPGVGAATAKKIIAGRPYASVADLSKAGISSSTITKITPLVTVGAAPAPAPAPAEKSARTRPPREEKNKTPAATPSAVDLNGASQKELEALPGVGPATAKKIVAGRPYASVAELSKAGVSASTIEKVRGLVVVGASRPARVSAPAAVPPPAAAVPAPPPAAAPAQPAPAAAAAPTTRTPVAQAPTRTASAEGMVWVNTATKIFHREGDRWYGKTKEGKFMTEADALAAGYRETKTYEKKKQ
jgi:competence protein ComEA